VEGLSGRRFRRPTLNAGHAKLSLIKALNQVPMSLKLPLLQPVDAPLPAQALRKLCQSFRQALARALEKGPAQSRSMN
jgi:hypothetical protein